MALVFTVRVELGRVSGLFVGTDELADQVREALEGAESEVFLDGLGNQGNSEYEVLSWEVSQDA